MEIKLNQTDSNETAAQNFDVLDIKIININ